MDMLTYLTELIKTRKAVGIPGLGTIYKKKSPGRYDAETHSFLPPSYVLEFSTELKEQDLLVAHICKRRNISPDAAGDYISQFAAGIHKQLEEHQEADFHPLGTLTELSGDLVFKPLNDQNFGFDFYGLPALKDEVDGVEINKPVAEPVNAVISQHHDSDQKPETSEETTSNDVPAETVEETVNPVSELAVDALEAVVSENEIEEENPGDGAAEHNIETRHPEETDTVVPSSIPAERSNFPIIAGEDPSTAIDEQEQLSAAKAATVSLPVNETETTANEHPEKEQQENEQSESKPTAASEQESFQQETDDQPVFEEIEELKTPEKPVHHPVIETPEGIETTEEPVTARPTLNEIYAQSVRAAAPQPEQEPTPIPEKNTTTEPPVFYNSHAEDADKGKTPLYLKVLIVLLLLLIGAAAAYFIRPDLFDSILQRQPTQKALPLDPVSGQLAKPATDTLATSPAKDTAKKDTSAGTKQAAATAKPTAVPPAATAAQKPVETPAPAQTGTTFEVIGSSVASQKEADRFIAQMKTLGINAKAIPPAPGKKKIKISVATFKDEAAARAERPKLEEKLGIKGLYIHTNKPL